MAPTAIWTLAEEATLLDFLVENKAEAGDGGNFKQVMFQQAIESIKPLFKCRASKTMKSCQNKWAMFRKIYRVICAIKTVSGWVWDDETGASINPNMASSWDDYVNKHPEAKPFHNKGWVHLAQVLHLMPSTAIGANVYHPTASQDDTPGSPAWPDPLPVDDSDDDEVNSLLYSLSLFSKLCRSFLPNHLHPLPPRSVLVSLHPLTNL
ncbi:hypothetical protein HYPSUDRAFT_134332 [Hypholoma sublateritium FD-334 SS-4]|uniref:Myb/SANT-like domain-containing protein n=1 Tax=Hypholoma sublateritium (strain FD-334 SS-4) TaxID=945553 RepID=A0A0D2P461_HYPSF|nr:hypothetical protein HYPSUDRAFT_134332 [Hypholoma sublateritium FD-334 SS-4]